MITVNDYANSALDATYLETAGPLLRKIDKLRSARSGELQTALAGLDEEAARLAESGQPMTPDNPVLEKALRATQAVFVAAAALIVADAMKIEDGAQAVAIPAVTAKVFGGLALDMIRQGIDPVSPRAMRNYRQVLRGEQADWNAPEDALDFATRFMETAAWIDRMEGWGVGYSEVIKKTILAGMAKGFGPKQIAADLRRLAENIPRSAAENLTRTLLITAYREAALAMEQINGGYIIEKVRIAKLDSRTCLSCIALHGTVVPRGQRIDDHYRGRCSEFYRLPGGALFPENMQADSEPGKRKYVPWQTGLEWFNSLPKDRQAQQQAFINSPAAWQAFQSGMTLDQFVAEHNDPVFGRQIIQASLLQALGKDGAAQYYAR